MSSLNDDEKNENTTANSTPLNMTNLNEEEEEKDIEIKKEIVDDVQIFSVNFGKNKKNTRKKLKKEEKDKKKR